MLHDLVKATITTTATTATMTTTTSVTSSPELHRTESLNVDIVPPIQNGGLSLPNNDANDVMPTLKAAIKLEDKLISGEEIEICPNFRVDSQRNAERVPRNAELFSVSKNPRQRQIPKNEASCLKPDKSADTLSNRFAITADNYPKLYITVANTSDKNAIAKDSLLKSIHGIQSSDGDSYGINISKSRFFVPKNYIFSSVECSMNDLKFEVDPKMARLLRKSHSTPQTSSSTLVDVEVDRASWNGAIAAPRETETQTSDETATRQCQKSKRLHSSLTDLRLKESEITERKQRLFLKKRDSKPSREIVDSLLDDKFPRPKASAAVARVTNHPESSDRPRDSVHTSKEDTSEPTKSSSDHKPISTSETPHDFKIEPAKEKTAENTQSWTPKHVIIHGPEIPEESASDATVLNDRNILGTSGGSETPSSSDKSVKCAINSPVPKRSTGLVGVALHDPPSSPSTRRQYEAKRDGSSEQRHFKYSNLRETNRANRIEFLQNSLRIDANERDHSSGHFHAVRAHPPEDKLGVTDREKAKQSQTSADPARSVGRDQDRPFGRTSSLRGKYETIVEDVELRTMPGRRSRVAISCDRKSLAHLSVLWESLLQVHRSQSVPPTLCVRPGKPRKAPGVPCASLTSSTLLLCRPCCPLVMIVARLSLFVSRLVIDISHDTCVYSGFVSPSSFITAAAPLYI